MPQKASSPHFSWVRQIGVSSDWKTKIHGIARRGYPGVNESGGGYGCCRSSLEIFLTKLTISYPLFCLLAYSFYDAVGSKRADENASTTPCPDDLAMSAFTRQEYTHSGKY